MRQGSAQLSLHDPLGTPLALQWQSCQKKSNAECLSQSEPVRPAISVLQKASRPKLGHLCTCKRVDNKAKQAALGRLAEFVFGQHNCPFWVAGSPGTHQWCVILATGQLLPLSAVQDSAEHTVPSLVAGTETTLEPHQLRLTALSAPEPQPVSHRPVWKVQSL